jgi:hypothetical protein
MATQATTKPGAQHKADWEIALARAEKAEKELAETKAKILVPAPKTSLQLTQERNVATLNGQLVVSLREQVGKMGAEQHALEQQLKECRAALAHQVAKTTSAEGTRFRMVPLDALVQAAAYAVALVRRCGMYAAKSAVLTEELGRHMFIRHLEREFVRALDCDCVKKAYLHIEGRGINIKPTSLPEVNQAVNLYRHYGTYKYPEVAAPPEPDQAKEKKYVEEGIGDSKYRGVKQAALKAQGAHKAEIKVKAEFREICPDSVVEDHDFPSTSTGPGAPVDDDEKMGEPLD